MTEAESRVGRMRSATVVRRRRLRLIHRSLALLVGLQVLLWVAGGLFMSAFPIELVRGEHLAVEQAPLPLAQQAGYRAIEDILAAFPTTTGLELRSWQGRPVFELRGEGRVRLVDARSGMLLSPIDENDALAVARADYAGDAPVFGIDQVREPALEYRRQPLPLWRVRFADALDTTLYVSPDSGRIVARRNAIWRAFDFVWMLHIMDYSERSDFNHPLLIAFAATALAFVVSGLLMLWYAFRAR